MRDSTVADIIYLVLLISIVTITSCSSITIAPDKKCKFTNLTGANWANNDLTSVLTFNDDCTGVVQMCNKYFTYEMVDYGTVYITIDATRSVGDSDKNRQCPNNNGVYKCLYSLTHLTESNIEVMDISCAWNNYKTEQLTRYEK